MMFDFAKLPTKTLQGRQTRRACVRIKSLEKHKVNVKEGRRGQEEVKKTCKLADDHGFLEDAPWPYRWSLQLLGTRALQMDAAHWAKWADRW
jgi:hypothetical protein